MGSLKCTRSRETVLSRRTIVRFFDRQVTVMASQKTMTSPVVDSNYVMTACLRAVLVYSLQLMMMMTADASIVSTTDADCPQTCFCNVLSRIVYCSRRGLHAIPDTLPRLTLQLNVNGNHFRSRVLQRVNFSASHASYIEHLYLSDCGIETLEVNAFADLTRLRWLDLSDNRLSDIPDGAFHGLTLQHLFLNGNSGIRLLRGSFEGLVTSGLYLHDCALQKLLPDTLSPLNGTLVNLWLNANRLTGIDRNLASVFRQLSHLRLGANPLHCGCDALWLKRLYDSQGGATFRGAEPPTCWTPARLRARHFDQLSTSDLHCSAPSLGNVDAILDRRGTGYLRCSANGQPTPVIYWIKPSGKTLRFDVRTDSDGVQRRGRNEGQVSVSFTDVESGLYICVAKNEVGNVTLTVNVTWPAMYRLRSAFQPTLPSANSNRVNVVQPSKSAAATVVSAATDHDLLRVDVNDGGQLAQESDDIRLFTVSELVGAVVGTHLGTVLLFVLVLLPVHLVRAERRKRTEADNLRVRDSLLDKQTIKSSATAGKPCHRWPPARVDYDDS